MDRSGFQTAAIRTLATYSQWVCWKREWRKNRDGQDESTKPPYTYDWRRASHSQPSDWCSLRRAQVSVPTPGHDRGIGFVFSASDPFSGIDLDGCRDPATGELADWARAIVDSVDSYTEISPSLTGVKIIVEGVLPEAGRKKGLTDVEAISVKAPAIEMYSSARFFTITGEHLVGTPETIEPRQAALDALYARFFARANGTVAPPIESVAASPGLEDAEVLRIAYAARNGAKIRRLYVEGDTSGYPSASEADQALCNLLAFYTGEDTDQLDRLFRSSALYRDKWERHDYRASTLARAVDGLAAVYERRQAIDFDALGSAPDWPPDVLPAWLEDWVSELHRGLQVPRTLAALATLTTLSIAVQRLVRVQPRLGWIEPTNLYVVSVAEVGERKSKVVKEVTRPLITWERDQAASDREAINAAKATQTVGKQRYERLLKDAAQEQNDALRDDLMAEAAKVGAKNDEIVVPVATKLFYDNITSERLANRLAEQGGYGAVVSAEAGPFDLVLGRYTDGKLDMDVWLKAHAGDAIRVGRMSRPDDFVDDPALTVGVMVQPVVLDVLAAEGLLRGRGLLARFLFGLCPRNVGRRDTRAKPIGSQVRDDYAAAMHRLLACKRPVDGPYTVELNDAARERFERFEELLEPKLAEFAEYGPVQDWASKLAGLVLRLAGNLHAALAADFAEAPCDVPGTVTEPIGLDTMQAAIRIGAWALSHARVAFELMGMDGETARALVLVRFLEQWPSESIDLHTLHQKLRGRTQFRDADSLTDPVQLLVDQGLLVPETMAPAGPKGGRPRARVYRVVRRSYERKNGAPL